MKLLYITSLSGKRVNGFMKSAIFAAKNTGIEFYMVCNINGADRAGYEQDCIDYSIKVKHIPFERNPFSLKNIGAYRELLSYMVENHFDVVHCNTPIGGVLGRLAAHKMGIRKVIYQAHGFHFWKGAPLKNWLLYYPVEKLLAHYTDLLITINQEDYCLAKKKLKAKRIVYIPGVGVDNSRFTVCSAERKAQLREEFGIPNNATVMLSVGELNANKNHQLAIRALSKLENPDLYYIICGKGELQAELQQLAEKCNVGNHVKFAGFRTDVQDFYGMADLFVFTSFREGIPAVVMEAMSCGIPVIAPRIRGIVDMLPDSELLFDPASVDGLAERIRLVLADSTIEQREIEINSKNLRPFLLESVTSQYENVYISKI